MSTAELTGQEIDLTKIDEAPARPKRKYKLLHGSHHVAEFIPTPNGFRDIGRTYHASDPDNSVIETDLDLCKLFNGGTANTVKFMVLENVATPLAALTDAELQAELDRRTTGTVKPPPLDISDTLEAMTEEDLRKVAAEEEIDLGRAKTKESIIKAIRAAHG